MKLLVAYLIFCAVVLCVLAGLVGNQIAEHNACRERGGVPTESVCLDPKVLR